MGLENAYEVYQVPNNEHCVRILPRRIEKEVNGTYLFENVIMTEET